MISLPSDLSRPSDLTEDEELECICLGELNYCLETLAKQYAKADPDNKAYLKAELTRFNQILSDLLTD